VTSAARLLTVTSSTSRAILLLPPGLDYIVAFLGCLMAGVVAVPAYPPRNNRHTTRLLAVINDSKAEVIITTRQLLSNIFWATYKCFWLMRLYQ
jgi:acyl-CoA synthetase (AMP-forming)/AMP-acid ligase II